MAGQTTPQGTGFSTAGSAGLPQYAATAIPTLPLGPRDEPDLLQLLQLLAQSSRMGGQSPGGSQGAVLGQLLRNR